jgi:hypothetical protein
LTGFAGEGKAGSERSEGTAGFEFAAVIDGTYPQRAMNQSARGGQRRSSQTSNLPLAERMISRRPAAIAAIIRRATALGDGQQRNLLAELAGLPDGDRLCHGDFHPWNILGPAARPLVIDWTSASRGSPAADVCRSYVLIKPTSPDLAAAYVDTYAQISGERREHIFRWLPVVAAGLIDFNEPVRAFHVQRCKAFIDLAAELGAKNILLVLGEYIWQREVIPPADQWRAAHGQHPERRRFHPPAVLRYREGR